MSFLWETYGSPETGDRDRGGVLPALRRGIRMAPGTSPDMWPYYTQLDPTGYLTRRLEAEHLCLTTFGLHQQGKSYLVHQPKIGFGEAVRKIRFSGQFSEDAVDRRFNALATATQLTELGHHLQSLVQQMRAVKQPIGFDYTQLFWNLVDLQDEQAAATVRRRWGAQYFRPQSSSETTETTNKE